MRPSTGFGSAVALQGDLVLVGAPFDHEFGFFDVGSVYAFEFDGANWVETAKIEPPDPIASAFFGVSIGLDGDTAIFGADGGFAPGLPGAAYAYHRSGSSWTFEQKLEIAGTNDFGQQVDVEGDLAVVSSANPQQAWVYREAPNGVWTVEATLDPIGDSDFFGQAVALHSDRVVIGAPGSDDQFFNGGAVQVDDLVPGPVIYCTAKVTSGGCVPTIDHAGTASQSNATPFVISARQVPNQKSGLLFYGRTGKVALPFLGGTLCVLPSLVRTPVQSSAGNPPPDDCSGAFAFDFSAEAPLDPNLAPGDTVNAQYWFRDPPHPDGTGAGLSDALEFGLCD